MSVAPKLRRSLKLTTRLGLRSSGMSMTPEEFDALPDHAWTKGLRYELIRGVLVATPPPENAEIDLYQELGYLIRLHQEFHPQGSFIDKVLIEQTIYAIANRRRADHAVWVGLGRVPAVEKDVPAIVVEFVSKSKRDHKRDYEEKLAEYRSIGLREYWIVDRFQRIMTVYRNPPDGPALAPLVVREAESYQTDLLPGFSLPIARLLARADDWPPRKRSRTPRRKPNEGGPR